MKIVKYFLLAAIVLVLYWVVFNKDQQPLNIQQTEKPVAQTTPLKDNSKKKLKQKTKARVKHIAFNLIQLYAKRKLQKGFSFGPDTHIQHELEGSFMYEDTPDQYTATQDVTAPNKAKK